jgi:hypothetical protein
MKSVISIFLFLVSFGAMAANCEKYNGEEICSVAFVELLVTPEKYDGKIVVVTGFYKSRFEQSAIFVSNERARVDDIPSSIWMRSSEETAVTESQFWSDKSNLEECSKIDDGYTTVFGRFKNARSGPGNAYPGLIEVSGQCMEIGEY